LKGGAQKTRKRVEFCRVTVLRLWNHSMSDYLQDIMAAIVIGIVVVIIITDVCRTLRLDAANWKAATLPSRTNQVPNIRLLECKSQIPSQCRPKTLFAARSNKRNPLVALLELSAIDAALLNRLDLDLLALRHKLLLILVIARRSA